MRLCRHLQHWLRGSGPRLPVANVVPKTNAIRPWADTFPWTKLVDAVEQSVASRFPKRAKGGRHPVPTRVLLALELLKHAVGASDAALCERLRTDVAVMYACGLDEVQLESPQAHFVLPEPLAQFRSRLDNPLLDALLAIQAAAAMEEGLVRPAHLLVDTFPAEQGSQRVTEATTLYKAQKKSANSSLPSGSRAPPERPRCRAAPQSSRMPCKKSCTALAANAEGRAKSSCSWCAQPKRRGSPGVAPLPRCHKRRPSPSRRRPI